jgi:uncharacterized protein YceH (UPF0502 family)
MAWENRRKGKYYYRTRRVNGRVVKEYVGFGPEAEEAAKQDEADRQKRDAAVRAVKMKIAELDAIVAPLHEFADLVTEALFFVAGYHKPNRGPWRKKRKPKCQ